MNEWQTYGLGDWLYCFVKCVRKLYLLLCVILLRLLRVRIILFYETTNKIVRHSNSLEDIVYDQNMWNKWYNEIKEIKQTYLPTHGK